VKINKAALLSSAFIGGLAAYSHFVSINRRRNRQEVVANAVKQIRAISKASEFVLGRIHEGAYDNHREFQIAYDLEFATMMFMEGDEKS
jgi:hypothetical protein